MDRIDFTLKGAKEMESMLRDMGPKVATRLGDRALRAGAKPIVQEAKRLAPRRNPVVSELPLWKSITAVTSRKGRRANERLVLIGFKKPTSRRAHLQEFGTRHHSAQPFMRPALDSKHVEALTAMAETLAAGIAREEWKKTLSLLADGVEIDFGD